MRLDSRKRRNPTRDHEVVSQTTIKRESGAGVRFGKKWWKFMGIA
jgi:hypothetical protein